LVILKKTFGFFAQYFDLSPISAVTYIYGLLCYPISAPVG